MDDQRTKIEIEQSEEPDKKPRTRWHRFLAIGFQEMLTQLGIQVLTESQIMGDPPKADIIFLRKKGGRWTKKQLQYIPDGIRASSAANILIEFKYTESLNPYMVQRGLGYDAFYLESQKLKSHQQETFILSSKSPSAERLEEWGYVPDGKPGIYRSTNPVLKRVTIVLLNELDDSPYNAYVKCFGSRQDVKRTAFRTMVKYGFLNLSSEIFALLSGLHMKWFGERSEVMENVVTPEMVMEMGRQFGDAYLKSLPVEELVAGIGTQELLAEIGTQELLAEIGTQERLAGIGIQERLAGIDAKEIVSFLQPREIVTILRREEDLAELNKQAVLESMGPDAIEAYLHEIKRPSDESAESIDSQPDDNEESNE